MTGTPVPPTPEMLLEHADHVRALVRRLLRDENRVDDVVQQTWLTALERPPRTTDRLRGWLATVARNLVRQDARSDQRRAHRERAAARPEREPQATDVVERVEALRGVAAAVLTLDEPYRTTLLMRFFEDLSPTKIADRVGLPAATVRTRLRRGLDLLRGRLDADYGGRNAWCAAFVGLASAPARDVSAPPPVGWSVVAIATTGAGALAVGAWLWLSGGGSPDVLPSGVPVVVVDGSDEAADDQEDDQQADGEDADRGNEQDTAAPGPEAEPDDDPDPPVDADPPTRKTPPPKPDTKRNEKPKGKPTPGTTPRRAPETPTTAAVDEVPKGLVSLPAVNRQPIGMDDRDVVKFIDEIGSKLPHDKKRWKTFWEQHFLLMTPEHRRHVEAFRMGRYEVTNAQWAVFLGDAANQRKEQTQEGLDTLAAFASGCWGGGRELRGADLQRAWLYLLAINDEVLEPHLNPDGAEDWDPLVARAGTKRLPGGLELSYTRYLPPSYWKDQPEPPEDERSRPVREISWEMATDFCFWAGLHLPTEFEWERAARGAAGNRFAWGNDWDPLKLVWLGYNEALKKAETPPAGAEKIGNDRFPDRPVAVDSFGNAATPEGAIHHLQGNVTEWVANKPLIYEKSKSRYDYNGIAYGARGGCYRDTPEVFLATDRTWDGPGGSPLRPRDALESYGFRVAMYNQLGADLALPIALRYDDSPFATQGPPMWRPIPIGLDKKTRQKRSKYQHMRGFEPLRAGGVVERQWFKDPKDHAYIAGPAKGVVFLPVKGFPQRSVNKKGDLARLAVEATEAVLLGVLISTPGLRVKVGVPTGETDKKGKLELEPVELDLHDARFYANNSDLLAQEEYVGAFLVLRPEGIAVMSPDPGNSGNPTKYLRNADPIGYLLDEHAGGWSKFGSNLGVGTIDRKGNAVLTVTIPPIPENADKARLAKALKYSHAVRLTLLVPLVGW